jgi:hypothetical protein
MKENAGSEMLPISFLGCKWDRKKKMRENMYALGKRKKNMVQIHERAN